MNVPVCPCVICQMAWWIQHHPWLVFGGVFLISVVIVAVDRFLTRPKFYDWRG